MNQLFSLYYYELKKNKNKFLIITFLVILFFIICITNLFYQKGYELNLIEAKNFIRHIDYNSNIPAGIASDISIHATQAMGLDEALIFGLMFIKIFGVIIVMILCFGVLIKGYGRKRKNFYIYSCLPVKMWKIKFSRILCCLSLYIYYMINITLSIVLIGFIEKIYLGKYYIGIGSLFYPNFVFMASNPEFSMFITFLLIPACIAGMQLIVNLLFVSIENKKIVRKIFSIVILLLCSSAIIAYIAILQIYSMYDAVMELNVSNQMIGMFSNLTNTVVFGVVIAIILFTILFLVDVRVSKKKFRGGV